MLKFNDDPYSEEIRDAARAVSLAVSILRRTPMTQAQAKVFQTLEDSYLFLLRESFRDRGEDNVTRMHDDLPQAGTG